MRKKPNKNFYEIYEGDRCTSLINATNSGKLEMKALGRTSYPGKKLDKDVLSKVYSIGYWDVKKKQNWGLDWHRNEGIEFTFLSSGNLTFSLGNEQFNLKPNCFTITRPWQLHSVGNPMVTPGRLFWMIIDVGILQPHQEWKWPDWIILSKQDLNFLTKVLRQNEIPVWENGETLLDCFSEIGKCIKESQTEVQDSKLKILINNLLLEMLGLFKKGKIDLDESLTINLRSIEIFLHHLRTDYERNWTLEEMAGHCGMGITSLTKYCKQLTNLTPINYLIKIRLEAAAGLLVTFEKRKVTEIGYECGFSSSQYFATAFKKQYELSPKNYRESLRLH